MHEGDRIEKACCTSTKNVLTMKETDRVSGVLSLDGIPIGVPWPLHYLEALGLGLRDAFPDDAWRSGLLGDIESLLGYELKPAEPPLQPAHLQRLGKIIGWFGAEILGHLVDREWLVTEKNEFEPLRRLLDASSTLAAASRVSICGSGVCRLGEYLASRNDIAGVECMDLSFLGLHLGRLLAKGEGDRLPRALRRPRLLLTVDPEKKMLRSHRQVCRFHSPSEAGREKLTFRVADAFNLTCSLPADLVFVPYVLDVFASVRMTTVLVRICERLAEGQKLLLLVTANPRRDPRRVCEVLRQCGCEIVALQLHELPYSLASYGSGFVRTIYTTLMLEAVKTSETDLDSLDLAVDLGAAGEIGPSQLFARESLPGQKQKPLELAPGAWSSLRSSLARTSFGQFRDSLRQELGEPASENVVAYLLASGCLSLAPRG